MTAKAVSPRGRSGSHAPGSSTHAPETGVAAREQPHAHEAELLTEEARDFLGELARRFEGRRQSLLRQRPEFHRRIASGELPDFLPSTRTIRSSEWTVVPPASDLTDRRVEITGPPDRKMVINALNSGANVYMADFEDAHAPTWEGTLDGQSNLFDAVRRRITFTSEDGREYRLASKTATLMVRPRGWHLIERYFPVDGAPISASLFDFGLFFFHNARELRARGSGPYFYLPKVEHYPEAELWNDVFRTAEAHLGLGDGTIRATALIETLPAVFEMDEILWALRERSAGLNCGRWDYIFSFIKQFRDDPEAIFPDRSRLTMEVPFLHSYASLVVKTCHRRGAHALGGMAAQIPIRDDPRANEIALARVVADKEREVRLGHDGTWVAHPGLVAVARKVFDTAMPTPNQITRRLEEVRVTRDDLLRVPKGPVTERGVRTNVRVGLRYLESWLRGVGCVPIDHLMEDAATAEIARTQLWQWVRNRVPMEDGRAITPDFVRRHVSDELRALDAERARDGKRASAAARAAALLEEVATAPSFEEFLTLRAYPELEEAPEVAS